MRVLVTGGSGKLGKFVVAPTIGQHPYIDWRRRSSKVDLRLNREFYCVDAIRNRPAAGRVQELQPHN